MRRIHDIILYKATAIVMTAVAILLTLSMPTSCCRHNRIVDEDDMPITLRVSSTDTKAAVNSLADMANQCFTLSGGTYTLTQGAGFGVYGFKYMSGSQTTLTLFRNQLVQPGNTVEETQEGVTDANWSYTPVKYWDSNPNVYYHFLAYWPRVDNPDDGDEPANQPYIKEDNEILTLYNIPYWQDGSTGSDFMFSAPRIGQYKSNNATPTPLFNDCKVHFEFSHILSHIVVQAYYVGDIDNRVTINNLTMRGINFLSDDGHVESYTKQMFSNEGSYSTATNTAETVTAKDNIPKVLYNDNTGFTLSQQAFYDAESQHHNVLLPDKVCSWLTVPSDGWSNLDLDLSFSISDGATAGPAQRSTIRNLSFDTGSAAGTTLSGKSYTLTLKFNSAGGGVTLEEVYVKDWTEQNIAYEVYNW